MTRSMGAAGLRWTRTAKDGIHFSTRLVSGHTKDSPCNGGIGSEEDPHEETVTINRRQPLESGIYRPFPRLVSNSTTRNYQMRFGARVGSLR